MLCCTFFQKLVKHPQTKNCQESSEAVSLCSKTVKDPWQMNQNYFLKSLKKDIKNLCIKDVLLYKSIFSINTVELTKFFKFMIFEAVFSNFLIAIWLFFK